MLLAILASLAGLQTESLASEEEGNQFARMAVVAAMQGDADRKDRMLEIALDENPDNRLANWSLGKVLVDGDWTTSEEYEANMKDDVTVQTYRRHRESLQAGKYTEWELANWCRDKKMFDAERLHLNNILASTESTQQQKNSAIQRLGLQNVGGTLMTREEVEEIREQTNQARTDHESWLPIVRKHLAAIEKGGSSRASVAIKKLRAKVDVSAVNTLEMVLSNRNEITARVAVEAISAIPELEATESLVRHASLCRWQSVRNRAIEELSSRNHTQVVPLLLATLENPLEIRFGTGVGADGVIRTGRFVFQEGRSANTMIADVSARSPSQANFSRTNQNGQIVAATNTDEQLVSRIVSNTEIEPAERLRLVTELLTRLAIARRDIVRQEVQRSLGITRRVGSQNVRTEERNKRAFLALRKITNADVDTDSPVAWWEWWNEQNERYQEAKPTNTRYANFYDPATDRQNDTAGARAREAVIREQAQTIVRENQEQRFFPQTLFERLAFGGSCECFPAGTLVRTQRGKTQIETILPGDRVLACDTESGELAYKLVLETTERPPSSVVSVKFSGGSVDSTSGHLFWVEEHGWKMAKNLETNDRLHTIGGSMKVTGVETIEDAVAYNLVVEDFETYFVTDEHILVHDNTEQTQTRAISPGLIGP